MTASLEDTRAALVADLEAAGFKVTESLDGKINAPAVLVACSDPYLTEGDVLARDELVAHLDLFIVFKIAHGQAMTVAVNRATQDLLLAIDDSWSFRDTSAPFRASNINGNPPVCRVRVSNNVRITEGN